VVVLVVLRLLLLLLLRLTSWRGHALAGGQGTRVLR
jgi:hypothetical protein